MGQPVAEHEAVARLALTLPGDVLGQECEERHRSGAVTLRGADVDLSTDTDGVLGDECAAAKHVDIADSQRGRPTPRGGRERRNFYEEGRARERAVKSVLVECWFLRGGRSD